MPTPEETSNQIRGYKATISNPNTSAEAKENAREMLKTLEPHESVPTAADKNEPDKNPGNVAGGLKATINNPNTSEEAKEHAEKRLEHEGLK